MPDTQVRVKERVFVHPETGSIVDPQQESAVLKHGVGAVISKGDAKTLGLKSSDYEALEEAETADQSYHPIRVEAPAATNTGEATHWRREGEALPEDIKPTGTPVPGAQSLEAAASPEQTTLGSEPAV